MSDPTKTSDRLDYAERWMRDALEVVPHAGFFMTLEADMSLCRRALEEAARQGLLVSYTHIIVKAVAVALASNPQLHQLVVGDRRFSPEQVDIGLSVSGESFISPILVLKDASSKSVSAIAEEVVKGAPEVRKEDARQLATVRKFGWLVPFSWLRRWFIRRQLRQLSTQIEKVGTFQLTVSPAVDLFVPHLFTTAGILGVGRVKERPFVSEGQLEVRPTVILSCSADHKIWDGVQAAWFLNSVKELLEGTQGELFEPEMAAQDDAGTTDPPGSTT